MKKLNLYIFYSVFFYFISLKAITLLPYKYHDLEVANRNDIVPIYEKLKIDVSPHHADLLKPIILKNKTILFFKEVTDFYEKAAHPSTQTWKKIEPQYSCLNNLDQNINNIINRIENNNLHQTLLQKWESSIWACRLVFEAELYNKDLAPGEVKNSDLNNLPGLIKILIDPMSHIPFADNLVTPELLHQMRFVFTKILYTEHIKNFKKASQNLQSIINETNRDTKLSSDERKNILTNINILKSHLKRAKKYIEEINSFGIKQAQKDRESVLKLGRFRDELPYPNLSDNERRFITFWLSQLYWRLRGGGIVTRSDSTHWRRLNYTIKAMSIIAKLNGGERAANQGFLFFLGLFKGYSTFFDMGRNQNQIGDEEYDLAKMTERGIFLVNKSAQSLKNKGYDEVPMKLAGLQMGSCYIYPYEKHMNKKRIDYTGPQAGQIPKAGVPYLGFLEYEIDWGENCVGAAIGVALSESLLNGYELPGVQ